VHMSVHQRIRVDLHVKRRRQGAYPLKERLTVPRVGKHVLTAIPTASLLRWQRRRPCW